MNKYERRRKALQHLLDYWEQSIGMMKAVDYIATEGLFISAVQWRKAINKAIANNESNYHAWKIYSKRLGEPPWDV